MLTSILFLVADFVWDFIHHKPGNCLINLCKDRCGMKFAFVYHSGINILLFLLFVTD